MPWRESAAITKLRADEVKTKTLVIGGDPLNGTDGSTLSGTELAYLDGVTPGTAEPSKAMVLSACGNIDSVSNLGVCGTLNACGAVTMASTLAVDSNITTCGSLIISGNTLTGTELGYVDGITPGTAAVSKALVLSACGNIAGISNLSACGTFNACGAATLASTLDVDGDITACGDIILGGNTISSTELGYLDGITPGTAAVSKALILSACGDIAGISDLSCCGALNACGAVTMASTLAVDGNITACGDFILGGNTLSSTELGYLDGITPGTAAVSKALVLSACGDIAGISDLSCCGAFNACGAVTMASTLAVDGNITACGDFILGGNTLSSAELGYLDGITIGTGAPSKALVLSACGDIASISDLSCCGAFNACGAITGASTLAVDGTLGACGAVTLGSTLDVAGNTDITGDFNACGAATLGSTLQVDGNLTACGNLVMGAVTITEAEMGQLNAAMADASFTIGSEASDVINVGMQLKDADGNDIAYVGYVHAFLSESTAGLGITTVTPDGTVAIGTDGAIIIEETSKIAWLLQSESDGDIDMNIGETSTQTWYMAVILPNGKHVVSGAISFST